ncbi:hypothetical protein ACFFF7_10920 [Novosphingobium aquiterrae]|uniref:AcrB/AcrD/AcrF family protein n=1 Tax=Novosphingobium aquiterrae TaxID=624388 RepID=A0ABV6PJB7_9SPHN
MRAPTVPAPAGLLRRVLPFWLGFAALYLLYRWPYVAALRQGDPDDTLRLVQVRDLLAGQGWFDLHQYRVNPPQGVVMHWSRLVDLPLAAVELLLRPLLGAALAEQAATVIVPLLTFGAILYLLAVLSRRLFDDRLIGYAALLAGTSFPIVTQILPTRVDHHGWQIVAAVAALLGLTDPDARRGGWIAGVALALGMTISLELLPLAALFGAVLALDWLRRPGESERFLGFMSALALTAIACFALTRGPDLTNYCDTISPAYLASLAIAAVGSVLTARFAGQKPFAIAAGLGVSSIVAGITLITIAPLCRAGPFAALDPLLRTMWASNVLEAMPVWALDNPAKAQWIVPPLAGLVATFLLWRSGGAEDRRRWFAYGLVLCGSLVLGSLVLRSMAFAIAFALVPLAWLVRKLAAQLESAPGLPRKAGIAALLLVLVMPAMPVYFADSLLGTAEEADSGEAGATGTGGDNAMTAVRALAALPRGTVFAPLDQGPLLLLNTRHSVVATGHHRGAPAMHDVMTAFLVDPPVARTILARHGVRYVFMAPAGNEVGVYRSMAPHGFAAQLSTGQVPDWLVPVAMPKDSGVLTFEVRQP